MFPRASPVSPPREAPIGGDHLFVGGRRYVVRGRRSELASRVFGLSMVEIDLTPDPLPLTLQKHWRGISFDELFDRLTENGVEHLTLRIDWNKDAISSPWSKFSKRIGPPLLIHERFYFAPECHVIPEVPRICEIETNYLNVELSDVLELARGRFEHGRFLRDPFFPRDRAILFYEEVLRSWYTGDTRSAIGGVALRRGRVVGFLFGRLKQEPLPDGRVGVICGEGFGAVHQAHRGCYVNLIRASFDVVKHRNLLRSEYTTTRGNTDVNRIFRFFQLPKALPQAIFHVALG